MPQQHSEEGHVSFGLLVARPVRRRSRLRLSWKRLSYGGLFAACVLYAGYRGTAALMATDALTITRITGQLTGISVLGNYTSLAPNARIVFYGDDPEDERFSILDKYLGQFDRIEVKAKIGEQKRWSEPKRIVETYAASAEEADSDKKTSMISVNWLLDIASGPRGSYGRHVPAHVAHAAEPSAEERTAAAHGGRLHGGGQRCDT